MHSLTHTVHDKSMLYVVYTLICFIVAFFTIIYPMYYILSIIENIFIYTNKLYSIHHVYIGYIEEWVQDIKAKERDLDEMLEKVKSTLRESNTRPSSSGTSNTLPTSLTSSEAEMNKMVEQAKIVVKKVNIVYNV